MSIVSDKTFLAGQYHDAANLNARIALHTRFSESTYGWFDWVFDQLTLPEKSSILELGCGSGDLWGSNQDRIPPGWKLTLSDISTGMAAQARRNLEQIRHSFQFAIIDAQAIPFDDSRFSAVIANHMLYHVPDHPRGLREIQRVIKPGGSFYATTIGERHLDEIHKLTGAFDQELAREYAWGPFSFTLENGAEQLGGWFSMIRLVRYPNRLLVIQAEPLADYILSNTHYGIGRQRRGDLIEFIQERLKKSGVIEITIDSGMFIARRL